ncbi:hypothetical protein J8J14_18185 [Roseomonas sp. SSH11]|uniref:Uncharacterized protein n=1 Tax=Pararoseomonas baculiformis TaxID=2820812 RepID=A0ABS4AKJ9_9PROT|nr:hypothetical protein [Pararoseomonas baculiformis]MBP0446709.1 hypothetical protein [Pararoseomonas baculiformis]
MGETNETARLQRILHSLSAEDVAFLARHPLPKWAVQARRRDERDAAIRMTRSFVAGMSDTEQARVLSRDLTRYLASGWNRGAGAEPMAGTYRAALHRIALLNNGTPIGAEQVLNVLRYSRSGRG